MSKDLVTMTIEIDREVYNKAAELFKNLGTTIEDMTVGFLKFCVIPENLPVLKAYFGIENAPAEAGAEGNYIMGFSSRSSTLQPRTRDNL